MFIFILGLGPICIFYVQLLLWVIFISYFYYVFFFITCFIIFSLYFFMCVCSIYVHCTPTCLDRGPTIARISAQGRARIEAQIWPVCKPNCNFTPQAQKCNRHARRQQTTFAHAPIKCPVPCSHVKAELTAPRNLLAYPCTRPHQTCALPRPCQFPSHFHKHSKYTQSSPLHQHASTPP